MSNLNLIEIGAKLLKKFDFLYFHPNYPGKDVTLGYDNSGKLIQALTSEGEDVTRNAVLIRGIPRKVTTKVCTRMIVRVHGTCFDQSFDLSISDRSKASTEMAKLFAKVLFIPHEFRSLTLYESLALLECATFAVIPPIGFRTPQQFETLVTSSEYPFALTRDGTLETLLANLQKKP